MYSALRLPSGSPRRSHPPMKRPPTTRVRPNAARVRTARRPRPPSARLRATPVGPVSATHSPPAAASVGTAAADGSGRGRARISSTSVSVCAEGRSSRSRASRPLSSSYALTAPAPSPVRSKSRISRRTAVSSCGASSTDRSAHRTAPTAFPAVSSRSMRSWAA
jgi:hypothetical protein